MRALREDRIGRYELLCELGRGGMAELFLGRLVAVGGFARVVAIKRILPHLAQDPQFKEMFLNEGRIAAQLHHQNICQVFELDESDGELFLAMEYLEGVSWDQLIRATPRDAALKLTVEVLAQACEGLHYAHSLRDLEDKPTPVIHRDVSPQNLFVTVDGVCKVLDFGVAKIMTDGPRTRTGVIKGKLPYMAPEQIRGDDIDGRADVFSLGVVAWEALAGTRLFDRPTDFAIWKAITEEPIAEMRKHWPQCPPAVEQVVMQALARDAKYRYATAREFARALRAAAGVTATQAELAEAVRTSCGELLEMRRLQVATAVTTKRESADTIRDGEMRLRSELKQVGRDAASTVDQLPKREEKPAPPAKSHLGRTILVALIAAALAAGIVAFVMSRQQERDNVAAPAQPEQTQPAPTPPPVETPAPIAEAPIDASVPSEVVPPKKTAKVIKPAPKPPEDSVEPAADEEPVPAGSPADQLRKAGEDLRKAGEDLRKAGETIRKVKGEQ